jgi:hypothetical protein
VFIHHDDETLAENLVNRRDRPRDFYRKYVLPKVIQQLNLREGTKARWSQYAGCSCPCSPGFILSDDGLYKTDIHVSLKGE